MIALLSGGAPVERAEWRSECCEELCSALLRRRRAPAVVARGRTSAMNVEGRNAMGDTAFLLACYKGHVDCMQLLAEAGCNTAAKDNDGQTALMLTACSGVAAAVHAALAAGWCELEGTDSDGDTAFLAACNQGHAECMQLLAEAGCNTAAKANDGSTALMHTAGSGVAAAARAALAVGWCELEATDSIGFTAFLVACNQGHVDCMQLLAEAGCNTAAKANNGATALMQTAFSGIAAAVRTALAAGWCGLGATNSDGDTAFLLACYKGHVECMQLLAEAGCNTAAKNNHGTTALMHTAMSGVAAAMRTALAAGWCELEATSSNGFTAFLRACNQGHVDCMQLLAEAGCNTAAVANGSKTARDIAQAAGSSAAVQWLLEEFAERERRAQIAEAELMAMLDSESATTNRSTVRQGEQAQRKKEKRRRQQQSKREAAARRTQAMTSSESEQTSEPVPEPEPGPEPEPEPDYQPDHQPAPLSPAVQAPASPSVDPEALTGGRTPPDEFCCPITSECMRDPVMVTATGMTYEREAIVKWLSEHDIDPSTGVELGGNKLLAPNVSIRKMIDAWSHGCLSI